jgi:hypothetical protein
MTVNYYINGVDFKTFGVKVTESYGLIGALKMKEPLTVNWPDHHGIVVDLASPRFDAREITLKCYLKAANSTDFISKSQSFIAAFQKQGTQRLLVDVYDVPQAKPLVYEVFLQDNIEITKKWRDSVMIGTFTIKLIEPEPVKTVYITESSNESITVESEKPVNIYWGDGSATYDVTTLTGAVEHSYSVTELHYIVITGIIDEISSITTGANQLWSKLQ